MPHANISLIITRDIYFLCSVMPSTETSLFREWYMRYIHHTSLVVYSVFFVIVICMIIAIKAIIGYQDMQIAIESKKNAITALQIRRMYEKQFVIPHYSSDYALFFATHEYGKLASNEAIVIPPPTLQS